MIQRGTLDDTESTWSMGQALGLPARLTQPQANFGSGDIWWVRAEGPCTLFLARQSDPDLGGRYGLRSERYADVVISETSWLAAGVAASGLPSEVSAGPRPSMLSYREESTDATSGRNRSRSRNHISNARVFRGVRRFCTRCPREKVCTATADLES